MLITSIQGFRLYIEKKQMLLASKATSCTLMKSEVW